jgi:hypothetical protein
MQDEKSASSEVKIQPLLNFYEKNGFLKVPAPLFSPEEFQKLKDLVLKTSDRLFPEKSGFRKHAWVAEPELIEYACHKSIIDFLIPFLGPNVGVFSAYIFKKKSFSPQEVAWHTDTTKYDEEIAGMKALSLTIAITEGSIDSGCVEYAPGSHIKRRWAHRFDLQPENSLFGNDVHYQLTDAEAQNLPDAVPLPLQPGEASLADISCVHRSAANNSKHDRINLVFRYFSTSKHSELSDATKKFWSEQKYTFLVAGEDQLHLCRFRLVV